MEPTRCSHPACGRYGFGTYCADHTGYVSSPTNFRGIGVVSPPVNVTVTARKRVRRNGGYIARNGAFIASPEASYGELAADLRDLDRAQARYDDGAPRRMRGKAATVRKPVQAHAPIPAERRITAADLAPIGDQNH